MSQRTGTVVTAPIRINDTTIPLPVAYQEEIQGGAHSGSTLASRDSLEVWHRAWGMTFRVYNDGVNNGLYFLKYGLYSTNLVDNQNWTQETSLGASNVQKLDVTANGTGVINLPSNCLLYSVVVNATGPLAAFRVGYAPGADDIVQEQPVSQGYEQWSNGRFLPGITTIYFTGVTPQSVCSAVIFKF